MHKGSFFPSSVARCRHGTVDGMLLTLILLWYFSRARQHDSRYTIFIYLFVCVWVSAEPSLWVTHHWMLFVATKQYFIYTLFPSPTGRLYELGIVTPQSADSPLPFIQRHLFLWLVLSLFVVEQSQHVWRNELRKVETWKSVCNRGSLWLWWNGNYALLVFERNI